MKSRILVVDDNTDLTTLLGKTLERFGYEVVVENDSTFAIDTTLRVRPNLILLDVMMPNRDGGEVLGDLRRDLLLRHIPVILLTGLAREAQSLADQGGIRSVVLSKPIELKLLLHEIETHIEDSKSFSQKMTDRLERETGQALLPSAGRRINAFGGPDPALLQKNRKEGMNPREIAGQDRMSPFQKIFGLKERVQGKNEDKVEIPR